MSLRAYARRRRVSVEAVSKAITAGRLSKSVVLVGGKPKIADPELADREWGENTRPRIDNARPVDYEPPLEMPGGAAAAAIADLGMTPKEAIERYNVSRALREAAAARRESALADIAEIDASERRGELVPLDEARAYMIDKFTIVKTRILGVPSRVAQRLPHLAAEVAPVVEALLREVLEELAAEDDGDGEEPVDA